MSSLLVGGSSLWYKKAETLAILVKMFFKLAIVVALVGLLGLYVAAQIDILPPDPCWCCGKSNYLSLPDDTLLTGTAN